MGLPTTTTLKDLFATTPIGSSTNVRFGESTADIRLWAEYAGRNGWAEETAWMGSGINYADGRSVYQARVRFGALFNNFGSVSDADGAIGFGATEAEGQGMVGAGATTWPRNSYPVQGTIWVKTPVPSPTSSPTLAPTSSPTSSPTASPTTSPTSAPAAPPINSGPMVKGNGDPHLANTLGQKFDLLQAGYHTLVQIPRWERHRTNFLVEARASRAGRGCADLFFTEINISGTWARRHRATDLRWDAEATRLAKPTWMTFHNVVNVNIVHGRTAQNTKYLNIFMKGLHKTKVPVGGLLGEDDHTAATTLDKGCKHIVTL
ncbi:unnamed protein product [Prorocentrum cordatum]|uniref:Uncharacterized protein n=1 Tax=Prorocentrum cordatum TaxID=2364126 RepID=A0ABN9QTX5_9DINO|nr:unnamed protein product [Polarella glacialis]